MSKFDVRDKYKMLKPEDYTPSEAPTESEVLKARKTKFILLGIVTVIALAILGLLFFTVPDTFWIIVKVVGGAAVITTVLYLLSVTIDAAFRVADTNHRAKIYGVREDE